MKRLLLMLFVAIVPCISFVSCEKDSDDETEQTQSDPLKGTTWYTKDTPMTILYSNATYWFDFDGENVEIWYSKDASGTYYKTSGTYKYTVSGNTLRVRSFFKDSGNDLTYEILTNGNRMKNTNDGYEYLKVLTKK